MDGGPFSDVALAHAFADASFHGDRLVALHAWTEVDSGFTGLLLGSTGLALVQHSDCPVMLVGPDAARAT
ncbi:hypothetical protein JOF36_003147 [Pseudonocardia parietis]|uniref:Universal stress protein family protein n=1 Tax=Pseudonocardia parietis TaxID=570936 RepID=A0ABS4VUI4_9PSEU|nr:universal stress protein [Pseudonocardia parietis]MBP2367451.1 hypothetical protein [Pseudonocardia parietis]